MTDDEIKATYIAFRSQPANDDTTDGMWCGQNSLNIERLKELRRAHPAMAATILEARRSRYAELLGEVDKALLNKAKDGDPRAAELLYRRFENWTPKQAEDSLKRNPSGRTLAELIEEDGA